MSLYAAEFVLQRRVRSVLDVGCGEGRWHTILTAARPSLRYTGVDGSDYAVRRFGASRNILHGTFGELGSVVPQRGYDMVVASDVIHYIHRKELERGISALAARVGGVAVMHFFTSSDPVEGDLNGMFRRRPRYYIDLLEEHGLLPLGLNLYAPRQVIEGLSTMEGIAAFAVHKMAHTHTTRPKNSSK